jgi:predicted DNA repair protein MutK
VSDTSFLTKAVVLAIVGIGITLGVYGAVALIVKADDIGVAMAGFRPGKRFGTLTRAFGRGRVRFMPVFIKALTIVGTAAMVRVGGGNIVHALKGYGFPAISDAVHHVATTAAHAMPPDFAGAAEWIVTATGSGLVGLAIGAVMIPLSSLLIAPLWRTLRD